MENNDSVVLFLYKTNEFKNIIGLYLKEDNETLFDIIEDHENSQEVAYKLLLKYSSEIQQEELEFLGEFKDKINERYIQIYSMDVTEKKINLPYISINKAIKSNDIYILLSILNIFIVKNINAFSL